MTVMLPAPMATKRINAGIVAIAHLIMKMTIDQKGIRTSTITTLLVDSGSFMGTPLARAIEKSLP